MWFSLKNYKGEDMQTLLKLLDELLEKFGFPFLEGFETRDKILKNVEETRRNSFGGAPRILLALIYFKRGNVVKATELFKKQYDESSDLPGHQEYLLNLSNKLGIKFL